MNIRHYLGGRRLATVGLLTGGGYISWQAARTSAESTTGVTLVLDAWLAVGAQTIAHPVAGAVWLLSGLYLLFWMALLGPRV